MFFPPVEDQRDRKVTLLVPLLVANDRIGELTPIYFYGGLQKFVYT